MENENQDPDDFLSKGVEALVASSEGGEADVKADDAGTREADTATEKETGVETEKSATTDSAPNSTPNKEAGTGAPQKPETPGQKRIRELNAQKKAAEEALANERKQWQERLAKIEERVAGDKKADSKNPPEIPEVVPKPKAPQYSIEQLEKLRMDAKANGDEKLLDAVEKELNAWREYKIDLATWKIENGQAFQNRNNVIQHYRNEAAKKFPELKNSDSPIFKTFKNVSSRFPELLNRADGTGEYWAAVISDVLVKNTKHDAELGALKTENEKYKAQIEKLTGKLLPGKKPKGEADLGKDDSTDDPDAILSRGLREGRG